MLSRLPLVVLQAVGALLGWITFAASPTYRRRFVENARLAGYRFGAVAAAVGHAGRMATEAPRLWFGRAPQVEWSAGSAECIEAAYAAGRGILFFTPHLGCFEICAQAVSARYSGRFGPITVLFRPSRQPWLSRLMAEARDRPGLRALATDLNGVRQMVRALRAGQGVGLLPDQVPPEGMGQWTPFFGRPAYTMTLGARLALQTGCELLLIWGERLPRGKGFRLHLRAFGEPLARELDAALLQINQRMEALIRECPAQYLWGYGRYKQPRRQPTAEKQAPPGQRAC